MIDDDGVIYDDGDMVRPIPVFLRTAYNYDMDVASERNALISDPETRTQQQFKEETDINTIVERFGLTGEMPMGVRTPFNADFEESLTYQEAMNRMIEAGDAFMQYPAEIRAKFQNDPGQFVDFVSDPKNVDQVRAWGLGRVETPRQGPIEVRVIADPPPEVKTP